MKGSDEALRIYGFPERTTQLPLTFVQSAVHPDDRSKLDEALKHLIESDTKYNIKFRIYRNDDRTLRHVHSIAEAVRDDTGTPLRIVGTVQDITEQVLLEEQYYHAQRLEAVGQFASGVAHDISNLITAINGHAGLALMQLETDDRSELEQELNDILLAADRITSLNSRLLAFSRKPNLDRNILDLNQVVRGLEKMLRRLLGEEIIFDTELYEGELLAMADVSYLEQVIMNLVVNARDAMPKGGRLLLKSNVREADSEVDVVDSSKFTGQFAVIEIQDSGVGIDPKIQKRIFEPFFTTKDEGSGTGLGLATVFGVIKNLDGHVQVDSAPNRGTTFTIWLPTAQSEDVKREQDVDKLASPQGEEVIMIVEDDEVVRNLAASILSNHGYAVHVANNGARALTLADELEKPVDLVLTDVVMPNLRGPEMVEKLRLRWPDLRVLYMSGYAARNSGMISPEDNFIQKPFTIPELTKTIRALFDDPEPD
jgi:PAS domain S-box-containing protein